MQHILRDRPPAFLRMRESMWGYRTQNSSKWLGHKPSNRPAAHPTRQGHQHPPSPQLRPTTNLILRKRGALSRKMGPLLHSTPLPVPDRPSAVFRKSVQEIESRKKRAPFGALLHSASEVRKDYSSSIRTGTKRTSPVGLASRSRAERRLSFFSLSISAMTSSGVSTVS